MLNIFHINTVEIIFGKLWTDFWFSLIFFRTLVDACNEGDFSKVRKLLDEGRVSVHDTTEEGESLLSLACSAGYYELAQVRLLLK